MFVQLEQDEHVELCHFRFTARQQHQVFQFLLIVTGLLLDPPSEAPAHPDLRLILLFCRPVAEQQVVCVTTE